MKQVEQVHRKLGDELVQKYDNVVATGVGTKHVGGADTGAPAIILFVREKVGADTITAHSAEQVLPEKVNGVPTDVIEVGDISKQLYTQRVRPVLPGYSISQANVTAGTLGGLFLDRDGELVVLSNNHVLADENRARTGDPIYQPGTLDAGPGDRSFLGWSDPLDRLPYFATLKGFVPLSNSSPNRQDSAIAAVPDRIRKAGLVSANYPSGKGIVGFAGIGPGTAVQKFGRTTGHTQSRVIAVDAKFTVNYDMGPVTFENCIVTGAMSRGGDSGSVLLDENYNAVGLLFAGSDKVTLFNPIEPVRQQYGLQPWGQPEVAGLELWGRTWKRVYLGLQTVTVNPQQVLLVDSPANRHAYLETAAGRAPGMVSLDVFSGTDGGCSWGPGLVLAGPTTVKVNLRAGHGFGAAWNGQEQFFTAARPEPNRWYTLRITAGPSTLLEVADKTARNGRWYRVAELPPLPGGDYVLRVGKTDVAGGQADYPSPGVSGRCQLANLTLG